MTEVILTREDANTEFGVLVEWRVADGAEVRRGDLLCTVETTKAVLEIEAPADGFVRHLHPQGAEVPVGAALARLAATPEELAAAPEPAPAAPAAAAAGGGAVRATRKAAELAEAAGIDLASIRERGFVTEADVEAAIAARRIAEGGAAARPLLHGVDVSGVSLPDGFDDGPLDPARPGLLDPAFLARLRAEPDAFRALPSAERVAAYRAAGAAIGEDVDLGAGTLVVAGSLVLGDGVRLGDRSTVIVADALVIGPGSRVGAELDLRCRRAFLGTGIYAGERIRIGGGGHRDPWAVLAIGDLAFLGDEAFVNVCRPVVIGRETFTTMRSMILTHNVGHSLLEGFENRFAPVVLEDGAQVGVGAVIYAGCRVGAWSIVASSSYVVADVPAGRVAIGVPARAAGEAHRRPPRARQLELARGLVDDLADLLEARGHALAPAPEGERGFAVVAADGPAHGTVILRERTGDLTPLAGADAEVVVLVLEHEGGEPPAGVAVIDLLDRRLVGDAGLGPVLDAVREICRKRGMRIAPHPWSYPGGLV